MTLRPPVNRGYIVGPKTTTGTKYRRGAVRGLAFVVQVLSASILLGQASPKAPVPIPRQEVYSAITAHLRAQGIADNHLPALPDVELPTEIRGLAEHTLRVVTECWDAELLRAQFRLECLPAGRCTPFLAYVPSGTARLDTSLAACRLQQAAGRRAPSRRAVIASGDRATVVFRSSGMRLAVSVTCLDRGAEGEVIRVRNQDGHIFRARVTSATLLEAVTQ